LRKAFGPTMEDIAERWTDLNNEKLRIIIIIIIISILLLVGWD
jgi:hypothetical protein